MRAFSCSKRRDYPARGAERKVEIMGKANFEKYGWEASAEDDALSADNFIETFIAERNAKDYRLALLSALNSIAKSLVEIRDELRKEKK